MRISRRRWSIRTAAALLGLEPAELMLVTAHPADLVGVRRAGLPTAFVDRRLEYGSGSARREDPPADESVTELGELAGRIRSSRRGAE
jgi:2-haloacid dehalogenase